MAYKKDAQLFIQAYKLYLEGNFQQVYDLLTESAYKYPEELAKIYEWRIDLAARLGQVDLAESIFKEALDTGFYYGERTLRLDDDLKEMQGRPVFETLVKRDLEILKAVQIQTSPKLEVLYHAKGTSAATPLFMALHGNNSNVDKFRQYWGALWNKDWLTVLPQSSQVGGKDSYVWNDMATVQKELKEHYAFLNASNTLDAARTIISGFSKGGHAAIEAAVDQYFPIKGFLAIAPYIGKPEDLVPHMEKMTNKHLRGYIIAGDKDTDCISGATWLHEEMKKRAICCEIKVYPELAHEFPDDFDTILPDIIHFLLGG